MMKKKLKAMVLAAGIGSRLEPLTSCVPKPLVQIAGRPVMEHILLLLKKYGVTEVVSNTYHLGDKLQAYFSDIKEREGITLNFVNEPRLSGVAGGIRKCRSYLEGSTALIIMGDALTNVDLGKLYEAHKKAVVEKGAKVTIAQMQIEDTTQFGVIVTNEEGRVTNFQEKPKAEDALSNWANTGIYFFEPEVLDMIPSEEEAPEYDVAGDLFPKLLANDVYVQAVAVDEDIYWADIGTPKQYIETMQDIAAGNVKFDSFKDLIRTSDIDSSARLLGDNEIGDNTSIAAGAEVKNCDVWDNVKIGENVKLEECIVISDVELASGETHANKILVTEVPVKA